MGSIIALPPRFRLHLRNEGGKHISLICALKADLVDRWLPEQFEWTDRRLEACLNISNSTIRSLLLNLSHEMRHAGVGSRELGEAIVQMLPIELARNLIAMDEPTEYGGLAAWRLRAIDRRISEPGKMPTLTDLANECRVSVRQLTRGFRTSRGCSIGDYLAQQRIDSAKRRLATDETIKSIALSTGFSSQSTFTYTFRRATGVTPHEYRKRVLRAV
jgi:AraC family transcriptional regulator